MGSASPAVSDSLTATWKVVLAYDGTDYRGWQVQPGMPTIQGELADAIERVTGERVLPQGSGRTDAGVHALGQVASFPLRATIPPANFKRALNRTLAPAIRIISAEDAAPDFHARHSATGKTYEYRVKVCDPFAGEICPPWLARFVYAVEQPLNLNHMQQAAQAILGEHDFTSFAAFDPDRTQRAAEDDDINNTRTIRTSSWTGEQPGEFTYRVTGNGFLHHMVRNLVGTFLEVGWGSRQPDDIRQILAERDRAAAGRTAPARGLFLHNVEYGGEYGGDYHPVTDL
jgi:tRNA pseudouridine38-40 synthase